MPIYESSKMTKQKLVFVLNVSPTPYTVLEKKKKRNIKSNIEYTDLNTFK